MDESVINIYKSLCDIKSFLKAKNDQDLQPLHIGTGRKNSCPTNQFVFQFLIFYINTIMR